MREIIFKTLSLDGSSVEESKIVVNEGEMLIMQPSRDISIDLLGRIHEVMCKGLKDQGELVTLPHGIEFKVIKINQ